MLRELTAIRMVAGKGTLRRSVVLRPWNRILPVGLLSLVFVGCAEKATTPAKETETSSEAAPAQAESKMGVAAAQTPAQMLEQMNAALKAPFEDVQDESQFPAAFAQRVDGILAMAEKIEADPKATAEEKQEAKQFTFGLLVQGTQLGAPGYKEKLEAYAKSKSDFAPNAAFELLKLKLQDGEKPWPLVEQFLKQFPGNEIGYQILSEIIMSADQDSNLELASEAIAAMKESFPDAPENASLERVLYRLQLVGKPIELEGTTLEGKKFNIAEYKGKVVLVDFWATWCGPCIAELPNVKRLYEEYHDKGFEVVGISLDDNAGDVAAFAKDKKLPWIQLLPAKDESPGFESPLAKFFGIRFIPMMFLVDKDGKVTAMNVRGRALAEAVPKLLGVEVPKESTDLPAPAKTEPKEEPKSEAKPESKPEPKEAKAEPAPEKAPETTPEKKADAEAPAK